jgi:ABC-type nitrate/sulfonate/bicarbonate transport system substrate-binding protein
MKKAICIPFIAILLALFAEPVSAQQKVRINWTAVTGAQSGMHMAQQEGLFKKNGLEVELIHIPSSSRGIQTILAGEIAFSFMDGNNEVQADLKGANIALVAGATNRQVFSLMARPDIKRISDLRGKKIGITRIGSSTHTSALFALGSAGLKPSDYQILPLMDELMNLAKEGPEYVSVAVGTSRAYIKSNEDIVRRVVRAYSEGVQIFKTNKTAALKMIQNQLKVKEADIQEDTYSQFREYLEFPPYVSRKGIEAVIADVAEMVPAAKSAKPEDFIDMRFVAELEKEGFFRKFAVK